MREPEPASKVGTEQNATALACSATTRTQGVSTVVAMMLSYAAVSVVWILLFLAWILLGLPFGPEWQKAPV